MRRRGSLGFSLVELSIVVIVVGLLLAGLMTPLAAQQDMRHRSDTAAALAVAEEALIGFALANGRLPCPATATVASGSSGAGSEATVGSGATLACAAANGVLPWATLGLPETDAWGNRFSYRVSLRHAAGVDPARADFGAGCALNPSDHHSYDASLGDGPRLAAFAICTLGDIDIAATAGGTALATNVPAIVVAHGKNAAGAYAVAGTQIPGANGDEAVNAGGSAYFVASAAIDDQLRWLPNGVLVSRMLAAGRLP